MAAARSELYALDAELQIANDFATLAIAPPAKELLHEGMLKARLLSNAAVLPLQAAAVDVDGLERKEQPGLMAAGVTHNSPWCSRRAIKPRYQTASSSTSVMRRSVADMPRIPGLSDFKS